MEKGALFFQKILMTSPYLSCEDVWIALSQDFLDWVDAYFAGLN